MAHIHQSVIIEVPAITGEGGSLVGVPQTICSPLHRDLEGYWGGCESISDATRSRKRRDSLPYTRIPALKPKAPPPCASWLDLSAALSDQQKHTCTYPGALIKSCKTARSGTSPVSSASSAPPLGGTKTGKDLMWQKIFSLQNNKQKATIKSPSEN